MMVYVDTNVLIYAAIEQDFAKKERSIALLEECIAKNRLLISLLVLQEYVFTLAKLGWLPSSSLVTHVLKALAFIGCCKTSLPWLAYAGEN